MVLFISFQILFNLATIAGVAWVFFRKGHGSSIGNRSESVSSNWRSEWEAEREAFQQQLMVQLRSVKLFGEQTRKLLEEKQMAWPSLPPSLEESEIKNLVRDRPEPVIPTLAEFEAQKAKMVQENPLDLKSLLTEQLS